MNRDAQRLTSSHYKYFKTMAYKISILQAPFLIKQLCDPSLHPSSSTNSNSKALNSVNLWVQTENGLLKHRKGNSMDSDASATAKTHHWVTSQNLHFLFFMSMSTPQPGQASSRWCSLQLPSHHFSVQRTRGSHSSPWLLSGIQTVIPPTKKQTWAEKESSKAHSLLSSAMENTVFAHC